MLDCMPYSRKAYLNCLNMLLISPLHFFKFFKKPNLKQEKSYFKYDRICGHIIHNIKYHAIHYRDEGRGHLKRCNQ